MIGFSTTRRSAQDVIAVIQSLSRSVDLVTFDVFDTLIGRAIMPPDRTKVPAARTVARFLKAHGVHVTVQEALDARNRTERRLREETAQEGHDREIVITDVFRAWLAEYVGPEDAERGARIALEAELAGEESVCRAMPGMPQALSEAKKLGKRVACMSDMYLTCSHVRSLLDRCGYQGLYDACYLSSEVKRSKHSGRMYDYVREAENVSPARWLHFGDHPVADVQRPKKRGIRAYRFWPREHDRRVDRACRLAKLAQAHEDWLGADLTDTFDGDGASPFPGDVRYEVGFRIVGPVLANFVHQVLERIKREDISLALFPAREGFVLKSIFDRLKPVVLPDRDVRSEYAFLTRKAIYSASIDHIGVREIRIGLWSLEPTIRTLLKRFNLTPDDFGDVARECRIKSIDYHVGDPFRDHEFLQFVRHPKVLDAVREKQRETKRILEKYIDQLGFWDADRAALVDVGWRGTVQDAMTWAFLGHPDWPRLFGYYLAFIGDRPFVRNAVSSYEGLIFHLNLDPEGRAPITRYVEIFELATRAPHPTTLELREDPDTGEVVPVFQDTDNPNYQRERADRDLLTAFQAGIFDSVDAYARLIPFQTADAAEYARIAVQRLDRFLRLPRAEEGRAFARFYHSEDFGNDIIMQDPDERPRPGRTRSLSQWMGVMDRSLWPEGLVASYGVPGLVELGNLWRSWKARRF